MGKLKPVSFDTWLGYECPNCQTEYTESLEYVQKMGKILCGCGKVLQLERVDSIECSPVYKLSQPIKPKEAAKPTEQHHLDALSALEALGWKKKEAWRQVCTLNRQYVGPEKDFAEYVIREVHHGSC